MQNIWRPDNLEILIVVFYPTIICSAPSVTIWQGQYFGSIKIQLGINRNDISNISFAHVMRHSSLRVISDSQDPIILGRWLKSFRLHHMVLQSILTIVVLSFEMYIGNGSNWTKWSQISRSIVEKSNWIRVSNWPNWSNPLQCWVDTRIITTACLGDAIVMSCSSQQERASGVNSASQPPKTTVDEARGHVKTLRNSYRRRPFRTH